MRGLNLRKKPDLFTYALFDDAYLERLQAERTGIKSPKKTQKEEIRHALLTPMTIVELYKHLPHISPNNIAPLVHNLHAEGHVYDVGKKPDRTQKGLIRELTIWSSREEDKPRTDGISLLNQLFGVKVDPSKLVFTGYVIEHILDDAKCGIKTKVK